MLFNCLDPTYTILAVLNQFHLLALPLFIVFITVFITITIILVILISISHPSLPAWIYHDIILGD